MAIQTAKMSRLNDRVKQDIERIKAEKEGVDPNVG